MGTQRSRFYLLAWLVVWSFLLAVRVSHAQITNDADPIFAFETDAPHPWLADVPGNLARLVDVGRVRIKVDEAAVRAARRTALTAFRFSLAYQMRYRYEPISSSKSSQEKIKLSVRFFDVQTSISHDILFLESFRPNYPWESPLMLHEFDHVAISTDPRLIAMIESLDNAEVEWEFVVDAKRGTVRQQIETEIDAYVKQFQKVIEEQVKDSYKELDVLSADGQRNIPNRHTFFFTLFSEASLEKVSFPYLDLVRSKIRKVDEPTLRNHYQLR